MFTRPFASLLLICAAPLFAMGFSSSALAGEAGQEMGFAHEASDIAPDPRVIYGTLENGLRYAVMRNETPSGVAAVRMRIATGSLNETDAQQGLAHFLEHMAFNGSVNVPEGEMIKRLERYGLSFGADTNASTGFDQTTYKLNLPTTDQAVLDEAFFLMRETAENLLLDSDAIERERGVIASEKLARDSIGFRSFVDRLAFFTQGSGLTDRLPIGIDETIATMPREEFVAYYRGYYRPENTFIAFIGDIDPDAAIAQIERYFADWQPVGEALPHAARQPADIVPGRVGTYYHETLMTSVMLAALRPYEDRPDTVATRRENLLNSIASRILNRRTARKVERNEAVYLGANSGRYSVEETVDGMALTVRSTPADWPVALAQAEQDLRQALEFGFTQQELDEQLAVYRQARETAVERAGTRPTYASGFGYNHANALVDAFADERVFSSPESSLARFDEFASSVTVAELEEAFRKAWQGFEDPALYFVSNTPLDEPEVALKDALAASRMVAVAPLEQTELQEFAYQSFGEPGQIVADSYLEDADAHLITFANNVRLNFKQTEFDTGSINIKVRVGGGFMTMPDDNEGLRRLGLNLLDGSGVVGHTSDDLRSLFAGQRVGTVTRTHIDNDAFEVLGSTDARDLPSQLNLMAAKVIAPAFSEDVADLHRRKMLAWYPTHDSSPEDVAEKYLPRLVRSGDKRYGFDDLGSFLSPTIADVRAWIEPELRDGLIEITIVGDVEKDLVVQEVARTFGALATRSDVRPDFGEAARLRFPQGQSEPHRFYHRGTPDQALVYVYWPAPDASDPANNYRMNLLRALFRNKLTEVLREEMGATYSPGAGTFANSIFDGYGYMIARVTTSPAEVERVREGMLRVADEMRNSAIEEDAFQRAITPILEDLNSTLENNGYWLNVLGDAQTEADGLARFRAREPVYRAMTAAEVTALAAQVFVNEDSIAAYILPRAAEPMAMVSE